MAKLALINLNLPVTLPTPTPNPNPNKVAKLALALETGFEHPATFLFHVGEKLARHSDPTPQPQP